MENSVWMWNLSIMKDSQDYFSHKNNAKNVSKSKTRMYPRVRPVLIPTLLWCLSCVVRPKDFVVIEMSWSNWLTYLWHQDNNCVARKWSEDISQFTNQLLYDIPLLQHGKRLTSGGNESVGPGSVLKDTSYVCGYQLTGWASDIFCTFCSVID